MSKTTRIKSTMNFFKNVLMGPKGPNQFQMLGGGTYHQKISHVPNVTDFQPDTRSSTVLSKLFPVHKQLRRNDPEYASDVNLNLSPINTALSKVNRAITTGWHPDREDSLSSFITARTPMLTDRSAYQDPRGELISTPQKKRDRSLSDLTAKQIIQTKTTNQSPERIAETLKHENSHLLDENSGFDLQNNPLHTYASEVNAFKRASKVQLTPGVITSGTPFTGKVELEYRQKLDVSETDAQRLRQKSTRIMPNEIDQ